MAKSDFDLDDQEYDVVYEEEKPKSFFSRTKKNPNSNERIESISTNSISDVEKSDTSVIDSFASNQVPTIDNADVVFEDKSNMTFSEKVNDYITTINIRALVVIIGIFLIAFVIAFMVILSIVKSNRAYSADIIIPDVVYMGESSSVYVSTKYSGQGSPKKDVNNAITSFEVADSNILYILNDSVKGSSVMNTIIPVQEGRTTVEVNAKLDGKKVGSSKKEVVICPAFNTDLVQVKQISVVEGSTYYLKIDFGEKECSRGVTYSSSNEDIATVEEDGTITGNKVGKSILTIRRGTKSISLTIDVTDKYVSLQSFKVTPTELQLSNGEKYRLKVDYAPVNATNFNVRFYSNDEAIVKVSDGGLVEGVSIGSTTIKAVSSSFLLNDEIHVTVKDNNSNGFATNISLDKNEIKLVQGGSIKVKTVLTPQNVNDDVVSWQSLDENVAIVTSKGIIYAKNVGSTIVTASTDNGISKEVKVTVVKMKSPVITSSDRIGTDNWHIKPYVLSFSGSKNGTVYYYGTSVSQMNSIADKLTISNDENKTYYVKACTRVCRETCTDKKDKNGIVERDSDGEPIQSCSLKCSDSPLVCSDPVSYISKLDKTKPDINAVVGNGPTKQISLVDGTSLVQKWCVTNTNSYGNCKWKTIEASYNPVIEYTALKTGTYYVFAKDVAGNMSDAFEFEITDIE